MTPYLTKREFMEVYRVKHTRFWSEVRKGRIKVLHPTPRCILIKREDAEAWANRGCDMGNSAAECAIVRKPALNQQNKHQTVRDSTAQFGSVLPLDMGQHMVRFQPEVEQP